MGKHTQDQFQTIKFVELQVGDIIVAKYQRKVYRPYFIVTDIKILKDDHHTPYESMTMSMLGGREKTLSGLEFLFPEFGETRNVTNYQKSQKIILWELVIGFKFLKPLKPLKEKFLRPEIFTVL